jgi:hypothetical protein
LYHVFGECFEWFDWIDDSHGNWFVANHHFV